MDAVSQVEEQVKELLAKRVELATKQEVHQRTCVNPDFPGDQHLCWPGSGRCLQRGKGVILSA